MLTLIYSKIYLRIYILVILIQQLITQIRIMIQHITQLILIKCLTVLNASYLLIKTTRLLMNVISVLERQYNLLDRGGLIKKYYVLVVVFVFVFIVSINIEREKIYAQFVNMIWRATVKARYQRPELFRLLGKYCIVDTNIFLI